MWCSERKKINTLEKKLYNYFFFFFPKEKDLLGDKTGTIEDAFCIMVYDIVLNLQQQLTTENIQMDLDAGRKEGC